MPRHEDKTAEDLWQAVDALKRSPDATSSAYEPMSGPQQDEELHSLMPLAESLAAIFQEESRASSGQTSARLRLQSAIQADQAARPLPKAPATGKAPRFARPQHLAFMAILILVAMAVMAAAFWMSSNPTSVPVNSAVNPAPLLTIPCETKKIPSLQKPEAPQKPAALPGLSLQSAPGLKHEK